MQLAFTPSLAAPYKNKLRVNKTPFHVNHALTRNLKGEASFGYDAKDFFDMAIFGTALPCFLAIAGLGWAAFWGHNKFFNKNK